MIKKNLSIPSLSSLIKRKHEINSLLNVILDSEGIYFQFEDKLILQLKILEKIILSETAIRIMLTCFTLKYLDNSEIFCLFYSVLGDEFNIKMNIIGLFISNCEKIIQQIKLIQKITVGNIDVKINFMAEFKLIEIKSYNSLPFRNLNIIAAEFSNFLIQKIEKRKLILQNTLKKINRIEYLEAREIK